MCIQREQTLSCDHLFGFGQDASVNKRKETNDWTLSHLITPNILTNASFANPSQDTRTVLLQTPFGGKYTRRKTET